MRISNTLGLGVSRNDFNVANLR